MKQASQRRQMITQALTQADIPISATALAQQCSVSRQVIVGDVAILRASGVHISATPRGYIMERTRVGVVQTVACIHTSQDMGKELYLIVDAGGEVVDVVVEHPVYGQLTGVLHIRSRYDVEEFLRQSAAHEARPLSDLTHGIHLHTLRAPTQEIMDRVLTHLAQENFLYFS